MKNGLIYCATSPSGKIYIGQTTKSLVRRIQEHKNDAYRKEGDQWKKNYPFAKAIRKYGIINFNWKILYYCIHPNLLDKFEIESIKILNSSNSNIGYNATHGGQGVLLIEFTEVHRKKLSNAGKGRVFTEEHKKNMSVAAKKRMKREGNPMYKKQHTEETKQKISATRNKRNLNTIGELHHSAKITNDIVIDILQLRKQKISILEIVKKYSLCRSHIYDIIAGRKWNHIGKELRD